PEQESDPSSRSDGRGPRRRWPAPLPRLSVERLSDRAGPGAGRAARRVLDFVKVTIYGPAVGRPIEAIGRLVWRQSADQSCQGGCELLDMSPEGRKTLEEALATAA